MSSWTNVDEAAGAPLWSVAAIRKTPSTANRTDLFNDTTADNFISGQTIGLFNFKDSETPKIRSLILVLLGFLTTIA